MELSNKKRNLILAVMLVGAFISSLSQSLLTSALPSIMREFAISATVGQWLTTVYILVLGIVTAMLISSMYAVRMVESAFLLMPLTAYGIGKLKGEQIAHGNAIVNSLRQMSGALGSSILIAIMGAASANSRVTDIHGINVSFGVETGLILLGLLCTLIFIRKNT
jgi:hypothetical protein